MSELVYPEGVEEQHLVYLDKLRDSGECNMWGAAVFVEREFSIMDKERANDIVGFWMDTFDKRHKA